MGSRYCPAWQAGLPLSSDEQVRRKLNDRVGTFIKPFV